MRIATWNINGIRARIDFVRHWLGAREPDVVGLQELKIADDKFPHDAFESLGYQVVTHGQKSWNGVAILSREPAEVVQRGLPGQKEFGSRLITARISGLDFTTVYIPNGKTVEHDDFPKKLAWLDALAKYLEPQLLQRRQQQQLPEDVSAVLCGDFNICPAPIDSWNEELLKGAIFHTEAERSRYQQLLDLGLVDLFREKHPDTKEFSWWDYRGGAFHRRQGLRIDFLLGTPAVMSRVRSIEIDREYRKKKEGMTASDHAPVIVDLE